MQQAKSVTRSLLIDQILTSAIYRSFTNIF